jgi:pimeloyl-ACP methyl ester carboxylesterase
VVLVHGNMSSSLQFDVLVAALDERYDVYAPDLRGFGDSSYETQIDSFGDLVADLRGWVETADVPTPFHLVGWSAGAGVATLYAAEHPDHVRRMGLIAPMSTKGYPIYRKDQQGQPTDELLTTREAIAADPVQVAPVLQAQESGDAATMRTVWNQTIYVNERPEPERYDRYLSEAILAQRNLVDFDYALARFNVSHEHNGLTEGTGQVDDVEAPTLVVHGDDDVVVSREMAERVVADLDAAFVTLPDCGHSPLEDALGTLVTELETHFQRE